MRFVPTPASTPTDFLVGMVHFSDRLLIRDPSGKKKVKVAVGCLLANSNVAGWMRTQVCQGVQQDL